MNDKIESRVQKLLALSKSSNEHEAAAALRQLQKFLLAHNLDLDEVIFGESESPFNTGVTPNSFITALAVGISRAYGCFSLHRETYYPKRGGRFSFLGENAAAISAAYAFTVVARHVTMKRTQYIGKIHKNCKKQTKTVRADDYAQAMVYSIIENLHPMEQTTEQREAIQRFKDSKFPKLGTLSSRDRTEGHDTKNAWSDGRKDGSDFQLNTGVNGTPNKRLR